MAANKGTAGKEKILSGMSFDEVCRFWAMSDHWPLEDALRLVLGLKPRLHEDKPLTAEEEANLDLLRQLAFNCFGQSLQPVNCGTHDGEVHLKPVETVNWASKRGIQLPKALTNALEKSDIFGMGYEPPELRKVQCHRERSRAIAAYLWSQDATLTKQQVAEHPYMMQFGGEGHAYELKTIMEWIKEENPDRRPGRPKNKTS